MTRSPEWCKRGGENGGGVYCSACSRYRSAGQPGKMFKAYYVYVVWAPTTMTAVTTTITTTTRFQAYLISAVKSSLFLLPSLLAGAIPFLGRSD